ncbi:MAG: topoisomerase DNA-binding C4 zinc finger domain-containing protein [Streptococcus salivarius]
MHVVTSQIVAILKPSLRKLAWTCPDCHQGQIIERKTKRNRVFYGCDRYPDCEFTSWDIAYWT